MSLSPNLRALRRRALAPLGGAAVPVSAGHALSHAAHIADQCDAATRGGLVLAPGTVAQIGKAGARRNRWTAVAPWVIAALLAVVVWKMI